MEPYRELTEEEIESDEMPNVEPLPDHRWKKTIFGRWFLCYKENDGVPYMDPSYETYRCM